MNIGTYIVIGNVTVASGVTLTIEPGVQVKFAGYYALDTNGILNAQGTAANLIRFTSNNATPAKGNWNYLYLKNSASMISYAVIEYADNGVYTANSSPTIQNSAIQYNNTGIYTHSLAPVVQNNLIQNNTTGINVLGTASTKVMNNTITNNTTYGVYVTGGAGGQITGNTITGSSYGIYFLPTTAQAIAMPVNNNGIYNNGNYNLYAAAGTGSNNFSNKVIDAKSNWWGTTDITAIMAKIFDIADNFKAPKADISILLDGLAGNPLSGRFIYGPLSANTSWTLAQGPYFIIGNTNVAAGVTLTIDPGVNVKFMGNYQFVVYGTLLAQGQTSQKIKFTSGKSTPVTGDWGYLRFQGSGSNGSILHEAVVEYSDLGVYTYQSSPRVEHCVIQNNNHGIETDYAAPVFQNNLIQNNDWGMNVLGNSGAQISNNTITANITNGIYLSAGTTAVMTGNTITQNKYGIYLLPVQSLPVNATINNNSIYSNLLYNLYASGPSSYYDNFSSKVVNAKNNWWGTTDPSVIMAAIYDVVDYYKAPKVDMAMFLDGPGGNPIVGEYVYGTISQNSAWTPDKNPYMVLANTTVNSGVTLTVQPGVEVRFAGNYALTIAGTLNAQGTSANRIKFTSNRANPTAGDWSSLRFSNVSSNNSILSYATVEYAATGIYFSQSSPAIQNTTLQNNVNGIETYYSSPVFQNNLVQNNTNRGLNLTFGSTSNLTGNTIINNGYGIYLSGTPAGGTWNGNYFSGTINGNSIYGNTSYDLYADQGAASLLIDAKNNWWGTTDVAAILAKIYDNLDNAARPIVNFSPILDGAGGNPLPGEYVYGAISQNTTWVAAQNPYLVVANTNVNSGVTLTIQPGVVVRFAGNYSLNVSGTLNAQGLESNRITFTSNSPTPSPGDWQSIYFGIGSSNSILRYSTVEYAVQGINAYYGSPTIQNNIVQNNGKGVQALWASPVLTGNLIQNNDWGVYLSYGSTSQIFNNQIINNTTYGIYLDGDPAQNNGGAANYFSGTIHGNSILGSGSYDLYADQGDATIPVNAENNWWGTTDANAIALKIFDHTDNVSRPVVDFQPFLFSPDGSPMLTQVSLTPVFLNPRNNETTTIRYTLGSDANVTIRILDYATDTLVRTLIDSAPRTAGPQTEIWDGKDNNGAFLSPSVYVFLIDTINAQGQNGGYSPTYVPGSVEISNGNLTPANFDPYKGESAQVSYSLQTPGWVTLKVGKPLVTSTSIRTLINNEPRDVLNNVETWDGRGDNGGIVTGDQSYVVYGWTKILPDNAIVIKGNSTVTIDALTANPYVIFPIYAQTTEIKYTLSADALVTARVFSPLGDVVVRSLETNQSRTAGEHSVIWDGKTDAGSLVSTEGDYRLRLTAVDSNGNQVVKECNIKVFK